MCNNFATLSRQTAILAIKCVTSWIYTGLCTVDFHILSKLLCYIMACLEEETVKLDIL